MLTSNPHKYWLVSAIDDDPVKCQSFESVVDLAVAARELIEDHPNRNVYAFCFYGDRLPITKGPERYIIVPGHEPAHYALFGRSGELSDVDDKDGQVSSVWDPVSKDESYRKLTESEAAVVGELEDEPEVLDGHIEDDMLTEPSEVDSEH